EGSVDDSHKELFREGVVIDEGYKTMPADLRIFKSGNMSEVEVSICEGKFHQVKRMFEAIGREVKFLKRIEMGSITLDESLETGGCRELSEDELTRLKASVGKGVFEE
ncbi:MAG: 16S rRNA pseudouridine(516) synthase, partial [Bacillota bacterium]|nr:16S rRNA pseudouridine(516) synthase [Bacillota bacterium]